MKEWKEASDRFISRLEKVCLLVGALNAMAVGSIVAFYPGIVSKDAAVHTVAKPLSSILATGAFLTALVTMVKRAGKNTTYLPKPLLIIDRNPANGPLFEPGPQQVE